MKIAVCIPCHADTKAGFTLSLSRALIRTSRATIKDRDGNEIPLDLEVFIWGGSMLPVVRTGLVNEALKWGADWLLLADSDHTFPNDAFLRLLAHGKSVVGCNYLERKRRIAVARTHENGALSPLPTTPEKSRAGLLEEAASTGLGLCLVKADAVRAAKGPLFAYEPGPDGEGQGEDLWFFNRLREAGHPLFIDHGLSAEVGHISQIILEFGTG